MELYDTVLVPLPGMAGCQYKFFVDPVNKNENLCNLRTPRRLNSGDKFTLQKISIIAQHWSGDDLRRLIEAYGWFELLINHRIAAQFSMRDFYSKEEYDDIEITDTDDINARLVLSSFPHDWPEPETTEYVEKQRTEEESLHWPERARWLTDRAGLWLPRLQRKSTWLEPVTRKLSGHATVMLRLIGVGTQPIGK